MTRFLTLPLAVTVLLLLGCSNGTDNGRDADDGSPDGTGMDARPEDGESLPDQTTDATCGPAVGQVCCPGEANGCTPDVRSLLVCNAEGMGWDIVECKSAAGEGTICLTSKDHPAGFCAECIPGMKKCGDGENVITCNQFGTDWEPKETCDAYGAGKVCISGACVILCDANEKLNMYMGCDFWAVDLDNAFVEGGRSGYYDAAGSQYSVVVSNPHQKYPTTVDISTIEGKVLYDSHDNPLPAEPLQPGELRIYDLPRRDADGTVIAPLAYRIKATMPITAYQFNPLENVEVFSNDASLLLPSNVVGKYYFVMTREQTFDELRGFLTVVAVRTGKTTVSVTVTAPTLVGEDARTGAKLAALKAGDSLTVELQQFDVLNIETDEIGADLTGSVVLANKDVAVFGGSEASNAPNTNHCDELAGVCEWDGETKCKTNDDCTAAGLNTCCADHLEMQLFPVKAWGLRYLASKCFKRNQEPDVYRIIAAENNTKVTTIPPQANIPVLNRGEWVDFESKANFEIVAMKPIMVGQFLASEHAPDPNVNGVPQPGDAGTGDPAFILIVPAEQFRTDYVFLAPNKYELDYVTIVAPDGAKVDYCSPPVPPETKPSCKTIAPDDFELFGTGEFYTTKFLIADGVHEIHADKPVGVYVYGYDQYVSYGYPAGLDIKDLGLIKEPGE